MSRIAATVLQLLISYAAMTLRLTENETMGSAKRTTSLHQNGRLVVLFLSRALRANKGNGNYFSFHVRSERNKSCSKDATVVSSVICTNSMSIIRAQSRICSAQIS